MLNRIIQGETTDAPDLLIAHGLFGSAKNWGAIARKLADGRRVVSVDMRNHGDSPWHNSHGYEDLADDLADVIDGQWDVLGHSMGGKAAMMLALRHPGKVRRLIVADIAPIAYDHSQMGPIEAMRSVDLGAVEARSDATAQLSDMEPGVAGFLTQSLDLKEKRWRLNLDVLEAEMHKLVGFPEVSGTFDGPVLFLSGGMSDYVQRAHRDRIKALFPDAKFAELAEAGHWLHADKPEAVTESVRVFLEA